MEPHSERPPEAQPLPRENRQWTPLARALAATGHQWTLLIVLALAGSPQRLSALRAHLPGISTGVLNRHLQMMVEQELVVRQRFRELPPRVEYRLGAKGEALLPIVTALARWGMSHMWSDPQPSERIDIGALLRLLPALVERVGLPEGVVEMVVELPKGSECHVFDIAGDRIEPVERGAMLAWTRIVGQPSAWIQALGPEGDTGALRITGEQPLAMRLLAALQLRA
ncbi:MAG TPA: helix-turn-helix domain-containing protein [Solirubrobacteraceae bacterium]|jgi:DNA-binding HxlR family transcriptional regulator